MQGIRRQNSLTTKGQTTFILFIFPVLLDVPFYIATLCICIQVIKRKEVLSFLLAIKDFTKRFFSKSETEMFSNFCKSYKKRFLLIILVSFLSRASSFIPVFKFNLYGIFLFFIFNTVDLLNTSFIAFISLWLSYFAFLLKVLNNKILNCREDSKHQLRLFYDEICSLIRNFNETFRELLFVIVNMLSITIIARLFFMTMTLQGKVQFSIRVNIMNILQLLPFISNLFHDLLRPCEDISYQVNLFTKFEIIIHKMFISDQQIDANAIGIGNNKRSKLKLGIIKP